MGDTKLLLEESRAAREHLLRVISELARVGEELRRNLGELGALIPQDRWSVVQRRRPIAAGSEIPASPT